MFSLGVGAFAARWQAMRVAALRTCDAYWRVSRAAAGAGEDVCGAPDVRLVAAGLEPQAFTDLFDTWQDHDTAADANINVSGLAFCWHRCLKDEKMEGIVGW